MRVQVHAGPRPVLLWLRRDFRLTDNRALHDAVQSGRPIIPVVIRDQSIRNLGAASKLQLEQAIKAYSERLAAVGSKLVLRSGDAATVLAKLAQESGSAALYFSTLYDPEAQRRDDEVKARLQERGLEVRTFDGFLLHPPWALGTRAGAPYRVFTPYWRALRQMPQAVSLAAPERLRGPEKWPGSEELASWNLAHDMQRARDVVRRHITAGENTAWRKLEGFAEQRLARYALVRDQFGIDGCSDLSAHLTWGEISPRGIWNYLQTVARSRQISAEPFLRQLAWREFAWHIYWHAPDMVNVNWNPKWHGFPWRGDNEDAERWRRGQTGVPLVDAAMRQLHVTGRMHNRGRMVVASYLTKNLMTDWRLGRDFFNEYLTDHDLASNTLGWQWVAGSGPDAAPFFRIFNPDLQARKFDGDGKYVTRFLRGGAEAGQYEQVSPRRWLNDHQVPNPDLDHQKQARQRALQTYSAHFKA